MSLISYYKQSPVDFIYPTGRTEFNATLATRGACGGMPANGSPAPYPLSGGVVSIHSLGVATNIQMMYAPSASAKNYHDFDAYTPKILDMSPGSFCTTGPDFDSAGMSSGDNVTLLLFYSLYGESDRAYYQCADVTLTDAYTAPSISCSNTSTVMNIAMNDSLVDGELVSGQTVAVYAPGPSETGSSSLAPVADGSHGQLGAAAGGAIGASVTLVLVAGILACCVVLGWIQIGRTSRRHPLRNEQSECGSATSIEHMKESSL